MQAPEPLLQRLQHTPGMEQGRRLVLVLTDLREFCELLNDSPDLRATAVLRSLERVRRELESCPDDSPLTSPIQLTLQDTMTLARALLQRLR